MGARAFSFPHPVLGNGDDITVGGPACEVSCTIAAESVTLSIKNLQVGNPTLQELIVTRKAAWVVRLHCTRTYFRDAWMLPDEVNQITLPTSSFDGRVDVETFIATQSPLPAYSPAGLHNDYGGKSFPIGGAEILALGPAFRFDVDPDFDPLKAPVSSFLRVVSGTFDEGPFKVIWDNQEFLLVQLSKKDWEAYQQMKQDRFAGILHGSLVFPVLVEAIGTRIGDAELQDTKWVQRLQQILKTKSISENDSCLAAQALLDQPLSRAFTTTLKELNALE